MTPVLHIRQSLKFPWNDSILESCTWSRVRTAKKLAINAKVFRSLHDIKSKSFGGLSLFIEKTQAEASSN